MKKKFATYGLHNSRMVPRWRCSSTNFCLSSCSNRFSRRSCAGKVSGAFGRSSIAWSHIVCFGSCWDFSSLNTFSCHRYSSGILFFSWGQGCLGWIVTLPMKYLVFSLMWDTFFVRGTNIAFCTSGARKTIGNWVWSIHPFFQSILGWTTVNHGYPKMALCSPKLDRKNRSLVVAVSVLVSKLV
jgi:hypothetical protein